MNAIFFPGLPQGIAGFLNPAHIGLSLQAVAILQGMKNLPMAAGTNFKTATCMQDKRVLEAFLKHAAVMTGLAKTGILMLGEDLNSEKGLLGLGVFGLINTIFVPAYADAKQRPLPAVRVMRSWSSMRWVQKHSKVNHST